MKDEDALKVFNLCCGVDLIYTAEEAIKKILLVVSEYKAVRDSVGGYE